MTAPQFNPFVEAPRKSPSWEKWAIGLLVVLLVAVLIAFAVVWQKDSPSSEASTTVTVTESQSELDPTSTLIPGQNEQKDDPEGALLDARTIAHVTNQSKAGVKNLMQSIKEFDSASIDYAIENLEADFKANALRTAIAFESRQVERRGVEVDLESYLAHEKFTPEEIQYALNHVNS